MKKFVLVERQVLRDLIDVLYGPPHLIREMLVINNLPGSDTSLSRMMDALRAAEAEQEGEVVDRKFEIYAVNPCKPERIYTERDGVFFAAKDAALPAALAAYSDKCGKIGCDDNHLNSISLLEDRVWRYHKQEVKVPDTELACEVKRCIDGDLGDE